MSTPSGGFKVGEYTVVPGHEYEGEMHARRLNDAIIEAIDRFPILSSDDVIAIVRRYAEEATYNLLSMTKESMRSAIKTYLESDAFFADVRAKANEKTLQSTSGEL